jgi:tetratricopeptide (TPR) repeat protein
LEEDVSTNSFPFGRSQAPADIEPISPANTLVYARVGEYWNLTYQGKTCLLKDAKGFRYIQRLAENPNQEFHSIDLLGGIGPGGVESVHLEFSESMHVGLPADAGAMLDDRAKQSYRERLRELREILEDQQIRGDLEKASRTEAEIEFLTREIVRAVGLAGRDRRAGSMAERARLSVTRAIKASVDKISSHDPALGDFFRRTIKTGTFCSYNQDRQAPVFWQFVTSGWVDERTADSGPILLPQRTIPFDSAAGQTGFVGREQELDFLRRLLAKALRGERYAVMIGGAPGVGKTRLANELRVEASRRGFVTLVGKCFERESAAPLDPFVQMLEAAIALAPNSETVRSALGDEAAQIVSLLPQLRRTFGNLLPGEARSEQIHPLSFDALALSERALFDAIVGVLSRLTGAKPLLLLVDDMHWADESTLALLAHIARAGTSAPLIVIGTFRDIQLRLDGPLAMLQDELVRLHALEMVKLEGLSFKAVGEMIKALSGRQPPETIVDFICSGTEGNPFFIEELYRHLLDSGKLFDANGQFYPKLKATDLDIPTNVRLLIGRRLAKISDPTREVLVHAAIFGKSFTFRLLEATTNKDDDSLITCLEEAENAGLVSSAIAYPDAQFRFAHELIRRAVLEEISPVRLQRLHLKAGEAIERLYADTQEESVNDIALHFWLAGTAANLTRTYRHLIRAAQRALAQSGYDLTIEHARRAIELTERLPPSSERDADELQLLLTYGVAILATRGWYVPELGRMYLRAYTICGQINHDAAAISSVLFGLWSYHLVRGELPKSSEYADEMVRLSSGLNDDGLTVQANWMLGVTHFFMGRLTAARKAFGQCIDRYDSAGHRHLASRFGQDPCVSSLCFDGMALWLLGYPEQAQVRIEQSLRLARALEYPFSLAWCLSHIGKYQTMRRDYDAARRVNDEAMQLCIENNFKFYELMNRTYCGISLALQGKFEELKAIQAPTPTSLESDSVLSESFMNSAFAEAFAKRGKFEKAAALLERAYTFMNRNQERYVEAELERIRGELELQRSKSSTLKRVNVYAIAEQAFCRAMEIADAAGARSLHLRAAISFARLMILRGNKLKARQVLEQSYNCFVEGFDAPDLVEAKELLNGFGINP